MEFGDLFSRSWQEYKQNFGAILKIFLIFSLIPGIIFSILLVVFGSGKTQLTTLSEIITCLPLVVFGGSVVLILYLIMTLAYLYLSIYQKKFMSFGQAVKGGLGYFWNYILLMVLLFFFLGLLFLLLIIPGIIFSIYWIFAMFILVKENVGPWEAMKRSKLIVKGRWWGTLGYLILLGIIMWIISLPFAIPQLIYNFATGFSLDTGICSILFGIIASLSALITTPLSILFMKNFYLDRKGGKNIVKKK